MKIFRVATTFLSYLLYFTGALHLAKLINRKHCRIPIVTYHSITDEPQSDKHRSCLDLQQMVVTKRTFSRHIQYISKNYSVIGLDDLIDFISSGKVLPVDPLVITFDDGFRDNYTNAYPILKEHNCKATFFIIGNTQVPNAVVWLHLLYEIVDELTGGRFRFHLDDSVSFDFTELDNEAKIKTISRLTKILSRLSYEKKISLLRKICSQNNLDFTHVNNGRLHMSAEEISELCRDGNLVGAHTMSHDNLATLTESERDREITQSRNIAKRICHKTSVPFCYPHGTKSSYNEDVREVVKKSGFGCAVTTVEGMNTKYTDLYELKRIEIRNFNRIELMAHLSGLIGDIKAVTKFLLRKER